MSRPPKRSAHVDKLDATPYARERLRAVLDTLAGELSIEEACQRLGIGETRFYKLRDYLLQQAAEAAEQRAPGPKAAEHDPQDVAHISELEQQIADLKIELEAARLRTELALTMPHVLRSRPPRSGEGSGSERQDRSGDGAKGGRRNATATTSPSATNGKKTSRSRSTTSSTSKKKSKKPKRH